MNNYCLNLKLELEPITGVETLKNIVKDSTDYYRRAEPVEILNSKFIIFLAKLGLIVSNIGVYYTPPKTFGLVSSDASKIPFTPNDMVSLYYEYNGLDSTMNWYSAKEGATAMEVPLDVWLPGQGEVYKSDDVTWLAERSIINPAIIQVGTLHNVITREEDLYRLVIVLAKDGKRLTMADAKEIFAKYIVE